MHRRRWRHRRESGRRFQLVMGPKRIVDLCFFRMVGKSSSSLSGKLLTRREVVEQMSNAVSNDVRLLENSVHGLFRIWGKKDRTRTMKRATIDPINFQPVLGQYYARAGVSGEGGPGGDVAAGNWQALEEEVEVLTITAIDAPAEGCPKGGVGAGRCLCCPEDFCGTILAVPGDSDPPPMDLLDEVHPFTRKTAVT